MAHHDAGAHESATCCPAVINNNIDHVAEACHASRTVCDFMGASGAEGQLRDRGDMLQTG
jgi:hypothetical protein